MEKALPRLSVDSDVRGGWSPWRDGSVCVDRTTGVQGVFCPCQLAKQYSGRCCCLKERAWL